MYGFVYSSRKTATFPPRGDLSLLDIIYVWLTIHCFNKERHSLELCESVLVLGPGSVPCHTVYSFFASYRALPLTCFAF